jgi:hypothetical protein
MSSQGPDALIRSYLDDVERAVAPLPAKQRRRLVEDISSRIASPTWNSTPKARWPFATCSADLAPPRALQPQPQLRVPVSANRAST